MNETLPLCIHGVPVKFNNCDQCANTIDNYNSLSNRIFLLEEHKLKQLEENSAIFKTNNAILNQLEVINQWIEDHEEECLEYGDEIEKRMDEFEKYVQNGKPLRERIEKLENIINRMNGKVAKKPFKCQICDGTGIIWN
jgi:phosphoenolpyruvate-protein kinase (PTS system EI component)